MELGGVQWVRYVPEFGGNRDLDESDRLSVEVRRLTAAEVLAGDKSEDELAKWRDDNADKIKDEGWRDVFKKLKVDHLGGFYLFAENTRNFRNWMFEGEELDDGLEIALRLTTSRSQKTVADLVQDFQRLQVNINQITSIANGDDVDAQEIITVCDSSLEIIDSVFNPQSPLTLMTEVHKAINDLSSLYGDALKNYVRLHDGSPSETNVQPAA